MWDIYMYCLKTLASTHRHDMDRGRLIDRGHLNIVPHKTEIPLNHKFINMKNGKNSSPTSAITMNIMRHIARTLILVALAIFFFSLSLFMFGNMLVRFEELD